MHTDSDILGQTAIVTGASRGLGLGIARRLGAAGHRVVLAAREPETLEAAREQLGDGAIAVPTDVTSHADVERLVATTIEHFGSVELLVNAAATVPVLDPLETLTLHRFRRGFDTDVFGTLLVSQRVAPHMRTQGRGMIVNLIAARGGTIAGPAHLSVSPSQAALLALTQSLAVILGSDGITVHAVFPRLSPDGETGRTAAPALGVTFDGSQPTADDVGAAVVELLSRHESAAWSMSAEGILAVADSVAA